MSDSELSDREFLIKISANDAETNEYVNILKAMYTNLNKDIEEVKENQQIFKSRHEDLSAFVQQLEKRLLLIEKGSRAKNLLIFQMQDDDETNNNLYLSVFNIFKTIKVEIPNQAVESVYRFRKTKGKRPVMVRFISARRKSLMFTKLKVLNDLGLRISNDLTEAERRDRKQLIDFQS